MQFHLKHRVVASHCNYLKKLTLLCEGFKAICQELIKILMKVRIYAPDWVPDYHHVMVMYPFVPHYHYIMVNCGNVSVSIPLPPCHGNVSW